MRQQIVGSPIRSHRRSLVARHATDTAIIQVPDGDVQEDLDGLPGALGVADILLGPRSGSVTFGQRGGLHIVPEVLSEEVSLARLQRGGGDLDEARQVGALRRLPNGPLVHHGQQDRQKEVHDSRY